MNNIEGYIPNRNIEKKYRSWLSVFEDFNLDGSKKESVGKKVALYFKEQLGIIPPYSIQDVQKSPDSKYITIQAKNGDTKKDYVFSVFNGNFLGNSISEAQEKSEIPQEIQDYQTGVLALEDIMVQNNKEWFGKLNENDTVDAQKFPKFAGKTAKELHHYVRELNMNIEINNPDFLSQEAQKKLDKYLQKYLEITMGVGDTYQMGADYFYKTEGEIDLLIKRVVKNADSLGDTFAYFKKINAMIDGDGRRSTTNKEKADPLIVSKLSLAIFERIKKEFKESNKDKAKEEKVLKDALLFASLVSGRDYIGAEHGSLAMVDGLRNPALADEIVLFITGRPGGVFDKINKNKKLNIHIEDPILKGRSPKRIMNQVSDAVKKSGIKEVDTYLHTSLGISAVNIVTPATTYNELSLKHKAEISTLARILDKISFLKETGQDPGKITDLAKEVQVEAREVIMESLTESVEGGWFSGGIDIDDIRKVNAGKSGLGLSETELQAFELFVDMHGAGGMFDFADETITNSKTLGWTTIKIAATLAIVIGVTVGTGGLGAGPLVAIGAGASAGTAASYGFIDPRDHDSYEEMLMDLGSDFVLNGIHAVALEKIGLTMWSKLGTGGKIGLTSADLISGMGLEIGRDTVVQKIYHGKPLFGTEKNATTSDLKKVQDNKNIDYINMMKRVAQN